MQHAKAYVSGDGLDPNSMIGPMVSETQRKIVHEHVQVTKKLLNEGLITY